LGIAKFFFGGGAQWSSKIAPRNNCEHHAFPGKSGQCSVSGIPINRANSNEITNANIIAPDDKNIWLISADFGFDLLLYLRRSNTTIRLTSH
jgi:hypothetical protein